MTSSQDFPFPAFPLVPLLHLSHLRAAGLHTHTETHAYKHTHTLKITHKNAHTDVSKPDVLHSVCGFLSISFPFSNLTVFNISCCHIKNGENTSDEKSRPNFCPHLPSSYPPPNQELILLGLSVSSQFLYENTSI